MAIIWTAETQETKRCYKVYRSGAYLGTHILTSEQVRAFKSLPTYEVKPCYWISESR